MITFIISGITLGFLGSLHCVGMCGPIAIALPVGRSKGIKKMLLVALYNLGRMFTYAALGAICGLLGSGIALSGFQQALTLSAGSLLLISVFINRNNFSSVYVRSSNNVFLHLRKKLATLLHNDNKSSLFTIGILNGFLPCGLVYGALATSIATGNTSNAVLFMLSFAAGTFPAMITLPLLGNIWNPLLRKNMRRIFPVVMTITALLLIMRGLDLGIPYLSPDLSNSGSGQCHTILTNHSKNIIPCIGPNSALRK